MLKVFILIYELGVGAAGSYVRYPTVWMIIIKILSAS